MYDLTPITLAMPFHLGSVNSYLLKTDRGHILIDSGSTNSRAALEEALSQAGCAPGNLKLILITHGDFDHTGNAAYLRRKHGAKIAMGAGDLGMAERGDMFWGRKSGGWLIKTLSGLLFRFGESERFTPDLTLADGDSLAEYGLAARVLSIPGHSLGSIGVLTAGGELFCGDLLENRQAPALGSIMDDVPTARVSVEKLREAGARTIYPGHGRPFEMQALTRG